MQLPDVTLYGLAIAGLNTDQDVWPITSTGIAVSKVGGLDYDKLESRYTFQTSLNIRSPRQIFDLFIKFTELVEELNEIQESVLHPRKFEQRPTVLYIGKDNREVGKRLESEKNIQLLYRCLFDRKIKPNDDRRTVEILNGVTRFLSEANEFESHEIDKAYQRLAIAMNRVHLVFSKFNAPDKKELAQHARRMESYGTPVNDRLKQLKSLLDQGDQDAFNEIVQIAREEGERLGVRHILDWKFFSIASPWPDYFTNTDLQERFPEYCYLKWRPEFREAFMEAYCKASWMQVNCWVKQPIDERGNLFADPAALRLMDWIQVVQGTRTPEMAAFTASRDWQENLLEAANAETRNRAGVRKI